MSKAWEGGSTRQWRLIRAEVMEHNRQAYGGQCRARCLRVCTGLATQAHHTRGRGVTGDDPRFIEGVCMACNLHIGDPTTHDPRCPQCVNVAWHVPHNPPVVPVTSW